MKMKMKMRPAHGSSSSAMGYAAMALLSLQFGLQPILYKEFAAHATHTSVLVIACEACKFGVAALVLLASGQALLVWRRWHLWESVSASGLPACTYAVQNMLVQVSYQHLPPLIFNLINQTKLLWTALFVYLLMGKKFSAVQCTAMILLLSAAVLLSLAKDTTASDNEEDSGSSDAAATFQLGLLPVIGASILSGFGGAITQRSMQQHQRHTALVTMELSLYGSLFLMASMVYSSSFSASSSSPSASPFAELPAPTSTEVLHQWMGVLLEGWTPWTLLPVLANAIGGLLVGAVTKHLGGVLKSFALVGGIAFTAFVDAYLYGTTLSMQVWVAALLVAASMLLYSAYPYQEPPTAAKKTN